MHRRTKILLAAVAAGAAAVGWHRHRQTDRFTDTDDVWPTLEAPIPTQEPTVVPDPVADPADLLGAPTRPHLTLVGNLPLQETRVPAADRASSLPADTDRSGNGD